MSQARWFTGDTREVLRTLPDGSCDLVVTSPPFLALRSYLPADHPDKSKEIGSEATPGAFLDVLLDVTEELARVLAPHGSLVVELGDTYSGVGTFTNDDPKTVWRDGVKRGGTAELAKRNPGAWPLAKSLCMIPSSYAWALAYGRNPWTGRTTDPWRVRNLIAWCRPNPPVGALGDKFRPGTSYLTVACKSGSRYFDLDAVREPHKPRGGPIASEHAQHERWERVDKGRYSNEQHPAGAPPLDWWEIPTHPYPGSHYATFSPDLCLKPIKSMCPEKVCRVCGEPSRRITENVSGYTGANTWNRHGTSAAEHTNVRGVDNGGRPEQAQRETLGWTDCGCHLESCERLARGSTWLSCDCKWRRGVTLDPFAGSGTTLAVATGLGRDAIGIDLDPRNYDLARERIGMFLVAA